MDIKFGNSISLGIYGASHAECIGMTLDGVPAGRSIDTEVLQAFLDRRAPGRNEWSTRRKEPDVPEFISGIRDGKTTGERIEAVIHNTNTRPGDYKNVKTIPRPAHADYTAWIKYGRIETGGGKWSARLTAPLCIAGGIAKQILGDEGISVDAHIYSIAGIKDESHGRLRDDFPVFSREQGEKMKQAISQALSEGDSVGGIVECSISGMPAGVGDALFGGMENRISQCVFAVPAVKGIEFGNGFECAALRGSENNDPFVIDESTGGVRTATNNHGGILGGISSGMPIVFRVAMKPTPSISIEQDSVDLSTMTPAKLTVTGRHDPCIVPRAVPCIEAAAAIAVLDMITGGE